MLCRWPKPHPKPSVPSAVKQSSPAIEYPNPESHTTQPGLAPKSPLFPPPNSGKLPPMPGGTAAGVDVSTFVPKSYLAASMRRESAFYAAGALIRGAGRSFPFYITLFA
jgi:hypothetical protein